MPGRTHSRASLARHCEPSQRGSKDDRPALPGTRPLAQPDSSSRAKRSRPVGKRRSRIRPNPTIRWNSAVTELERFCGQLSLENTILKKSLATYRSKAGTK